MSLANQGDPMRSFFFRRCMTAVLGAVTVCAFAQTPSTNGAGGAGQPTVGPSTTARIANISAPGNLAPTKRLPCLDLRAANSSETPADIHTSIKACVDEGEFEKASRLFALAGVFARFDAERVADPSARDAGQMLILQTFSSITPDEKKKFQAVYMGMVKDPEAHRRLCSDIQRIGPPVYFPAYMVAHGMSAFTGANSASGPLVSNFDAKKAWTALQTTYLMCDK